MVIEYLQSLPVETWGFLGATGAGIVTATFKFFDAYRKEQKKQIERVASVIADTIQSTLSDVLNSVGQCEYEQRQKVKRLLTTYSSGVCRTARTAVENMVCTADCESLDLVTSLYVDAIQNTFLTDVLDYFDAELIGKKWLIDDADKEIEVDINNIREESFGVFLSSMRRRFIHDKIQIRTDWIAQNMDTIYMRGLISSIVHGCREIATIYKDKNTERHKQLVRKIISDLSK